MDEKRTLNVGLDMIYLAASALRQVPPDASRVEQMNLDAVFEMARFHSMQAMVYTAVADLKGSVENAPIDSGVEAKMRNDYGLALRKLLNLESERAALTRFLEQRDAWYLPLKGIILKDYYPKFGMRQMTDNDILIDPKFAREVRDFLVGQGYDIYSYGSGCHDVYTKGDVTLEIHRSLASEAKKNKKHRAFCDEAVKRSLSKKGEGCKLELSDEDFYIYFVFHAYKHFSEAGVGVRTLADAYVYIQKKRSSLDFEYLKRELSALGLYEFERSMRELAERIFSISPEQIFSLSENMSEEERNLLLYFVSSGTFGTSEQLMKNELSKISNDEKITARVKLKYIFRRAFPPFDYYKTGYPRLYKFIVTIPFLWLIRIFRGLKKSRKVTKEIGSLKDMK